MRVYVKFRDESGKAAETHAVVCNLQLDNVDSLKRKALSQAKSSQDPKKFQLAVSPIGALLSSNDLVRDILQDGDFVCMWPLGVPYQEAEGPGSTLPSYGISLCRKLASIKERETIELDGESLTIEDLIRIGKGDLQVKLSDRAVQEVEKGRKVVDDAVAEGKIIYGVTTGFGSFADTSIRPDQVVELQENLIRSHAAGVGPPLNMELTRMILTLRINVLAKGFSGVRLVTLQALIAALNASCLPFIPEQGTVGASGDLAPLAHLALGMMGEGLMWSPKSGWAEAKDVLAAYGLQPITLKAKEGLALINGTQLITALGAEAVYRAENIAREADVVAALTLQALEGTAEAYDKDIHVNRPHKGQNEVAKRLRALLCSPKYPSNIKCERKQDPYTLRCVPQVHGVVHETLTFVKGIIETEMNSAQDNPMVLSERNLTISGGNFHGEYPAKAVDYLAIGIHELANISERRMEKLTNSEPVKGTNLPFFLVNKELGGLNNGFMIAQYTAAALVSENKVLTHPASVDSITTSAGQEDHVSMGGYGARKALRVVSHVEQVLAIELLGACQGMEFVHRNGLRATEPLEKVHHLVRQHVKPWDRDRFMAPDIEAATKILREGKVWEVVEPYIRDYQE